MHFYITYSQWREDLSFICTLSRLLWPHYIQHISDNQNTTHSMGETNDDPDHTQDIDATGDNETSTRISAKKKICIIVMITAAVIAGVITCLLIAFLLPFKNKLFYYTAPDAEPWWRRDRSK